MFGYNIYIFNIVGSHFYGIEKTSFHYLKTLHKVNANRVEYYAFNIEQFDKILFCVNKSVVFLPTSFFNCYLKNFTF